MKRSACVRAIQAAMAVMAVLATGGLAWIALPLPSALIQPPAVDGLRIEDRMGRALRVTRAADGSRRQWMPLAEIDPDLIAAFVALEDRRFFEHHGIDPAAVARAAASNVIRARVVSGASTITMQLARLLRPIPRSVAGKVEQALWALRLEAHLGKDVILEQYLNRVPLGQGTVGVMAAADLYFGRSAADLSLGQAALLAGLARFPSGSNPLVSPARAAGRRMAALLALRGQAREDIANAAAEPVLGRAMPGRFEAPHFTTRILAEAERAGRPLRGTWLTSLDLDLQQALELEARQTVSQLGNRGVRQAALVVLDNATGEVLAWVGSPDFWADSAGQVDMVVSARQPGSALKPFVYGLAFDRGVTPATILSDIAHTYQTASGPYAPRNYDRRFHGPVRAREALASSFNVPAVQLADQLGVAAVLEALHRAGFTSLDHSAPYYGLGLALGNGDVTLLELANGYRAIGNLGRWTPLSWWLGEQSDGERRTPQAAIGYGVHPDDVATRDSRLATSVMSPAAAALVLDILRDPVARIPGFGLETPFDFPFPVAVKTGTSRHFTDNWAVGVTHGFTVAVWVGNFTGRPMDGVSGVTGAGPLLHRAVMLTAARREPGILPTPAELGARPFTICRLSGRRAGKWCPGTTEWFVPGDSLPGDTCSWHNPGGGVELPGEYASWARATGLETARGPERRSGSGGGGATGGFRIVSPGEGDRFRVPPGVAPAYATIGLRTSGGSARWTVDGQPVRSDRWTIVPGRHIIRARSRRGEEDQVAVEVLP